MTSYIYVTVAIFALTFPFHFVDSLAIEPARSNDTSSTNMTSSMTNETRTNCTVIFKESPSMVEVQLTELTDKTETSFNNLQDGLGLVLEQVLTNFTDSVKEVNEDNAQLMERLNILEKSIDEVKAQKRATEKVLEEIHTEELSCDYIRENVSSSMTPQSGLYWLRDKYGRRYVTYCDFDDAGRSWTLVASVHENKMGVDGRCSPGDKWSSELGKDGKANDETAWSDLSTFGDVTTATSGDYKNAGYFSAKARNVMIWHVKENTPVEQFKENAYLRYRTTNGFMTQYGGNMYNLYKEHFPHQPGTSFHKHGPSVQVSYDKGSWQTHAYHLGNNVKARILGGYIQFRAVNHLKDSFALCPGGAVGTSSLDYYMANYFCLGSNVKPKSKNSCGDFGNWDASGYGAGIDYSADETLVKTAFLIFYG